MRKSGLFVLIALLASWNKAGATEINWKNDFVFYGDNTEFFEPFRTGETILGQQGKSLFEASLGPTAFLSAGLFGDFRSVTNPVVTVKPILSFEYRQSGTKLVMGTLETRNRHGFLEPLEVTTLEFTRPVEYGIQWLQDDPSFQADIFLNWHQLNTSTEPETLDYGGVVRFGITPPLFLEAQMHGYHEGGQLYFVSIRNNWVYTLGFRLKGELGSLGEGSLAGFGLLSGDLGGGSLSDTRWGGGGYLRAGLSPGEGFEFFGIGWRGRDFFSKEGDANYSSFSEDETFYRADRFYAELGAKKEFVMEGGPIFTAEFRVHFIDEFTAYSYRLAVEAPFDLHLLTVDNAKKN